MDRLQLDKLLTILRPHIPFHIYAITRRNLDKQSASILDVGGGAGESMQAINRDSKFFTVNVDIFPSDLVKSAVIKSHNEYVLADIRQLSFKQKSFDIVLCKDVLEHLEKSEGQRLIEEMERIGRKQCILITPIYSAPEPGFDINPYQDHVSSWGPDELKQLGYKVKRYGAPSIRGHGALYYLPKPIGLVYQALGYPLGCLFPIGGSMIAVKKL